MQALEKCTPENSFIRYVISESFEVGGIESWPKQSDGHCYIIINQIVFDSFGLDLK